MGKADRISREVEMSRPLPTVAAQRTHCANNPGRPSYGNSQSWTAGRCQRLLRPITSRIELLKKDPIRYTTAGNPASIQTRTAPDKALNTVHIEDLRECEGEDAYWARGRKRVRRTYSARSKLQDVLHADEIRGNLKAHVERNQGRKGRLQPGEVWVPTPILKRSKSVVVDLGRELLVDFSMTAPPKSKTIRRPGHFEVAETMRRINKTTNAARFKVYEGIYNSLEALFKATMLPEEQALLPVCDNSRIPLNTSPQASKFPCSRSLFSMCLRSVPIHIKEEEKRFAIEAESMGQKSAFDTRVISTETYADLESLGTSQTGWKHLKTVVRMHGLLAISDAIEQGLLDADIASALVMLCVQTSFLDEAETLLTSLLKSFVYPDPKSPQSHFRDDPTLLPLSTLEKFVKYTGRICYYHRQIANIITSGSLSITWLGTKHFASIWRSLFRSLSTDPLDRDATAFMASVLPLLCRAQSPSFGEHDHSSSDDNSMLSILDTTLASVLTTLLAMSMLSISHRNISQILKSAVIDCQIVSSELHSHGPVLIVLANLLGSVEVDEVAHFLRQLVMFLGSKPHQFLNSSNLNDCIPSFVCSVARCCGRGFSGDGFEHLQIILERLMVFASLDNPESTGVLEQIVVKSAFLFADHFPDPKHLQYAQHIRAQMHRSFIQRNTTQSKDEARSETGFRWEEGINEWVMATPTTRLRSGQEKEFSPADSDSDLETPIPSGQKRRQSEIALFKKGRVGLNPCSRVSDLAPDNPKEYDEDIHLQMWKDCSRQDESLRSHRPIRELLGHRRSRSCTRPITKMRRLRCELLSSQTWILFEQSDDELNSTVTTRSNSTQGALQELPNYKRSGRNVPRRNTSTVNKLPEGLGRYLDEQSEDELGL